MTAIDLKRTQTKAIGASTARPMTVADWKSACDFAYQRSIFHERGTSVALTPTSRKRTTLFETTRHEKTTTEKGQDQEESVW